MISIAVPFLNEEENLKILIPDLIKNLDNNYEVLFINDGSIDKSEEVLFNILNKNYHTFSYKYINHEKQCGIGSVFKTAINEASGSHLTMLAADNEDNIQDIIRNVKLIKYYNTIMLYTVNSGVARKFFRRFLSIIFKTYLNTRFDTKILYFNAMGNIYNIDLLRKITITSSGFFSLAEVAIKMYKLDQNVIHCPRVLHQRSFGKSKSTTLKSLIHLLIDYKKLRI